MPGDGVSLALEESNADFLLVPNLIEQKKFFNHSFLTLLFYLYLGPEIYEDAILDSMLYSPGPGIFFLGVNSAFLVDIENEGDALYIFELFSIEYSPGPGIFS